MIITQFLLFLSNSTIVYDFSFKFPILHECVALCSDSVQNVQTLFRLFRQCSECSDFSDNVQNVQKPVYSEFHDFVIYIIRCYHLPVLISKFSSTRKTFVQKGLPDPLQ